MLETIRQFADEQLVEAGEALSKRNAHEAYYRQRLVEAVGRWDGTDQLASFDWLHSNMTNLRGRVRLGGRQP